MVALYYIHLDIQDYVHETVSFNFMRFVLNSLRKSTKPSLGKTWH